MPYRNIQYRSYKHYDFLKHDIFSELYHADDRFDDFDYTY